MIRIHQKNELRTVERESPIMYNRFPGDGEISVVIIFISIVRSSSTCLII